MKAIVKFRMNRCKGCELCVSVCPKKIIKTQNMLNPKGYHAVFIEDMDMKECIGCANCALMCPDGVISVYLKEEGDL
ncbi:MAG: 4Fe-4S binding protein [Anaerovoracaceae bacterium]|jgi:2-oxoglutarate ferredoxin oxidoreductase subunit delta